VVRKHSTSVASKVVRVRECGPAVTTLVSDVSRMGCQLMATAFRNSPYPIEATALAVDSLEVRKAVKDIQPDVAIINAALKDGPKMGLKVARELWASGSKTKIIILTDASVPGMVTEAFQVGAHGIIGKDDPFETLCKCIHVVHQGQVWINSSQLLQLIDYLVRTAPTSISSVGDPNLLTRREEGVVQLVAEGLTNRAISRELNLSEHTVRNYLFRIFNKLGTGSRLELALYVTSRRQLRGMSEGQGERPIAAMDKSSSSVSVASSTG
jgi:two-component system nitrate/nitrite response regulator NarL